MPITIRMNRLMQGMTQPYTPLTPQTMDDKGADALRLAVIERAIQDMKTGIIVQQIMTTDRIAKAVTQQIHNRMYNYRHDALRLLRSAQDFLKSNWCDTLGMGINIDYLTSESIFNSHQCAALLRRPYTLYIVKGKQLVPYLTVTEAMNCTLLGITAIMPPSLLGHIREDPITGIHTILFTRKVQKQPLIKYFGIEKFSQKCESEIDIDALYKRRITMENNPTYDERRFEDE